MSVEETFDPVAFLQQRRARDTYKTGEWLHRPTSDGPPYTGFRDPVGPGTVSVFADDGETQEDVERHAALLWYLALTHQIEVGKVVRMAIAAVYHLLDPIDAANYEGHTYDAEVEWGKLIEDARWDQKCLRELREQGGSLDEVVEIMERNRDRLEQMMERDPAHAEEIAVFLDASAERVRKMVMEHNRAVRQQRAKARMKES